MWSTTFYVFPYGFQTGLLEVNSEFLGLNLFTASTSLYRYFIQSYFFEDLQTRQNHYKKNISNT